MRDVEALPVDGHRVLVHANLDVPLENGTITDDTRLRADLDTYQHLLARGCLVIVCGHVGRPDGKVVERLSTAPIAERLSELLGQPVAHLPDCIGDEVQSRILSMSKPGICVLENLRFHDGEESADEEFAAQLARLADYYVNDDYISAHRPSATNILLPRMMPSARGYALKREWQYVRHAVDEPRHPFVLIIGGAKPDKIGVINHLLGVVDHVIVGGILANTFLKASGIDIKDSKYDERSVEIAGEFLREAEEKFLLPVDVVAANKFSADASHSEVSVNDIPAGHMILDIGSQTIQRYTDVLASAQTIIWGGPIGVFEWEPFSRGTKEVAQRVADSQAFSLIAGGDSGAAITELGLADKVSHVSIGGGATLRLIAGEELPAIEALRAAT